MDYLDRWKKLERGISYFRRQKKDVPAKIIEDLKTSKTLITILNVNKEESDLKQQIEKYLLKIEAYLIINAQKNCSVSFIQDLLKDLNKKKNETNSENEKIIAAPLRIKLL